MQGVHFSWGARLYVPLYLHFNICASSILKISWFIQKKVSGISEGFICKAFEMGSVSSSIY
jgi:hypothetical protein